MSFNFQSFGNPTLENMLPLFGNLTNGLSTSITNHPNFINQLAAMITTTETNNNCSNSNNSNLNSNNNNNNSNNNAINNNNNNSANAASLTNGGGTLNGALLNLNPNKTNSNPSQRHDILNSVTASLISPSKSFTKGSIPMDLENDLEQEALAMRTNSNASVSAASLASSTATILNNHNHNHSHSLNSLNSLNNPNNISNSINNMNNINSNNGNLNLNSSTSNNSNITVASNTNSILASSNSNNNTNNNNNNLNGSNSSSQALAAKLNDKFSLQNANLYLNSLMANPGGYVFFPTNTPAPTNVTNNAALAAAANNLLIDQASLMAAAMQQVQQNYTGFTLPNTTPDTTTSLDSNPIATTPTQSALVGVNVGVGVGVGVNASGTSTADTKDIIETKSCILFPPNPLAPPPTIRDRPLGCRTVFVGGLPENITEDIIREIFEPCGEITTLRMSKKNFCHIRYRLEKSIDRAIYLSGYRLRINSQTNQCSFGRLHVDYAQARDDQYDYECKQRQLQREQRHRERLSIDRTRSQSPPPIPHYTDHEASVISESLRSNETFQKAVQTICIWLERGDCTKRNANVFYTMIQITHGHVRRLHTDKQNLEEALRKTRENYRKQMLTMTAQFTQIEKVFSAASHKKVWDHFTKAQRKNIDQWKKLASDLRSVQIDDDEMEMSDDDRDYRSRSSKRTRYESESLKEENDSLRCQLEAMRNEMSLERTDIKHDSDFREKQIKVLQETIRNMQTQLLQMKMQEQRDAKTIEALERKLKEAGVKQLLLKTKIKETTAKLKDKDSVTPVPSLMPSGDLATDSASNGPDGLDDCLIEDCQLLDKGSENPSSTLNISIKREIIDLDETDDDLMTSDSDSNDDTENSDGETSQPMIIDANSRIGTGVGSAARNQTELENKSKRQKEKENQKEKQNEEKNPTRKENAKDSGKENGKEKPNEREPGKSSKSEIEKSDESLGATHSTTGTTSTTSTSTSTSICTATLSNTSLPAPRISTDASCGNEAQVEAQAEALQSFDAMVIALTTAFLVIHPHGATAKSICMYLQSINSSIDLTSGKLDLILRRYHSLFESKILNHFKALAVTTTAAGDNSLKELQLCKENDKDPQVMDVSQSQRQEDPVENKDEDRGSQSPAIGQGSEESMELLWKFAGFARD